MRRMVPWMEEDDLFQFSSIGMLKAIRTFKPEMGYKFSTYAGRCMFYEILREVNNMKRAVRKINIETVSIDENLLNMPELDYHSVHADVEAQKPLERVDSIVDLDRTWKLLPARQQMALVHWMDDLSLDESAKRMGVTRSRVGQLRENAIKNYQKLLEVE